MWVLGLRVVEGGRVSHLPGLAGPLLAALVVTGLGQGRAGLAHFARRLVCLPRAATVWLAILAWPAAAAVWHLGAAALGQGPAAAELLACPGVTPAWPLWAGAAAAFVLNGPGEEGGWRGWLNPELTARLGAFRGTLAAAGFWGLWQLPVFAVHEGFAAMGGLPLIG